MSVPAQRKKIELPSSCTVLCGCPDGIVNELCPLLDTSTRHAKVQGSSKSKHLLKHMTSLGPRLNSESPLELEDESSVLEALEANPLLKKITIANSIRGFNSG